MGERQGSGADRNAVGLRTALHGFLSAACNGAASGTGKTRATSGKAGAFRRLASAFARTRRDRRIRGTAGWIALGLIAWTGFWALSPADPAPARPRALLLARPLQAGEKVVLGDLALVAGQGADEITEDLLEAAVEAYAARDLEKGTRLQHRDLEWGGRLRRRVPEGKRAYPVEVESDVPLVEGDRIDLWPVGGREREPLPGVLVLDPRSRRQPILALSDPEIRRVEMMRQTGKLRVAVRGDRDPPSARRERPRRLRETKPAILIWEAG